MTQYSGKAGRWFWVRAVPFSFPYRSDHGPEPGCISRLNRSADWEVERTRLTGTIFMCSLLLGVHCPSSRCGKEVPWSSEEQHWRSLSRALAMPGCCLEQVRPVENRSLPASRCLSTARLRHLLGLISPSTLRTASPVQRERGTRGVLLRATSWGLGVGGSVLGVCSEKSGIQSF